jgi:hypothetical protein
MNLSVSDVWVFGFVSLEAGNRNQGVGGEEWNRFVPVQISMASTIVIPRRVRKKMVVRSSRSGKYDSLGSDELYWIWITSFLGYRFEFVSDSSHTAIPE